MDMFLDFRTEEVITREAARKAKAEKLSPQELIERKLVDVAKDETFIGWAMECFDEACRILLAEGEIVEADVVKARNWGTASAFNQWAEFNSSEARWRGENASMRDLLLSGFVGGFAQACDRIGVRRRHKGYVLVDVWKRFATDAQRKASHIYEEAAWARKNALLDHAAADVSRHGSDKHIANGAGADGH